MKKLVILGSTGSIGAQALEIVGGSDELEAVGLAAGSSWEPLLEQARRHGVPTVALAHAEAAERARSAWDGRVLAGEAGIRELIVASGADLVLNGMVGAAGLGPTVVALGEGIDVALANKESLVIGGELTTALAEATGARLLPVDSEHSALFQLIAAAQPGTVERLVLTASGGPFRGRTDLSGVSVEDALAHPTWRMGGRITIDSATLMNKGFEAIEAHHLFGVPYERIEVVVHPQSIVHSLVDLNDGATLAHLGLPDMRVPISYALHYPERADVDVPRLDLAAVGELSFEPPDLETFACLRLALEAGTGGGHGALRAERRRRGRGRRLPRRPHPLHRDRRGDRAPAGGDAGAAAHPFRGPVRGRCGGPPPHRRAGRGVDEGMSWVLVFLGFSALIVLHEAGHFLAAKATGMRVEKFFLFFGPKLASVKRGETEYGIASIPAGGYVKISGMHPEDKLPEGEEHRGYYEQPVWKRIVVIGAGPAVNIALAFAILFAISLSANEATQTVGQIVPKSPAAALLKPGDRIVSVDGKSYPNADTRRSARKLRQAGRLARVRRQAGRRLQGDHSGDPAGEARRRGQDDRRAAGIRRRRRPHQARLLLRRDRRSPGLSAARSTARPASCGWSPTRRSPSSPTCSTPNSARKSRAWSASATSPTRRSTGSAPPRR